MSGMKQDIAFFSEQGPRNVNQDAIYASVKGDRGIFVVADGMGGHFGGEVASGAIVNGIRNWWDSNEFIGAAPESVAEQCCTLLLNINKEVFSYYSGRGQVGGSTVAVLILWKDRYIVLSAGDSRIYRVWEKKLEQLTTDDVWENLPEVKYEMDSEKIAQDERFGRLTQALGSEERLRINRGSGMLSDREVFLLCSDGVYKSCSHRALENIMCGGQGFRTAKRQKEMVRRCAWKNGVDDNYSAVIVRVCGKLSSAASRTQVYKR